MVINLTTFGATNLDAVEVGDFSSVFIYDGFWQIAESRNSLGLKEDGFTIV